MHWLGLSLSLLSLSSVSEAGVYGSEVVKAINTDINVGQDVPDRLGRPEIDAANLQAFFEDIPLSLQVEQERRPKPRRFIQVPDAEGLPRLSATIAYPVLSDTFTPEALNRCLYRIATQGLKEHNDQAIRQYATFDCNNHITVRLMPRVAKFERKKETFKLATIYRDDFYAILHATIQWAAIVSNYQTWTSADRDRHISPYQSMILQVSRSGHFIGDITIEKTTSGLHDLALPGEALCARCPRQGRSRAINQAAAPSRPRQGTKRTRPKESSESDPDASPSLEEQSARDSPEKASRSSHEPSSSRTQTNGLDDANPLSPEDEADLLSWLDHDTGANGQIWK